jgi:hypothetical protein
MYAIVNCDCLTRSLIQLKRMSIAFDRFCLMLSVAMPMADVLLHMIMVGFCGCCCTTHSPCPIVAVVRIDAACCLAANRAAYSASLALATAHGIIEEKTWIEPLILVGSLWFPRKNIASATDRE